MLVLCKYIYFCRLFMSNLMIGKKSKKSQMVEMLKHPNKFSLIYHKFEHVEPIQQASRHQKSTIIPSPNTKQAQNYVILTHFFTKKPSDATSINVYCFQILLYYLMQIFPNGALIWGGGEECEASKIDYPSRFPKICDQYHN